MDGCQWMPHALSFGSAAPQMASSNLVKWYWKPTKPTRESFQANMQLSPEPWASSLAFQEWLNTKPCCKGPTKTTAVKSPSSCLNAIPHHQNWWPAVSRWATSAWPAAKWPPPVEGSAFWQDPRRLFQGSGQGKMWTLKPCEAPQGIRQVLTSQGGIVYLHVIIGNLGEDWWGKPGYQAIA